MAIYEVVYLFFRLAPYIIMGVFILSSLFTTDITGFFYVIGLVLVSACLYGVSGLISKPAMVTVNERCKTLAYSIGQFPVSTTILSYSFFFLLYTIVISNLAIYNILTILIFTSLIAVDIWWNHVNSCYPVRLSIISLVISASVALFWAYCIQATAPNVRFVNTPSNQELNSASSEQDFQCSVYDDNGNIVDNTTAAATTNSTQNSVIGNIYGATSSPTTTQTIYGAPPLVSGKGLTGTSYQQTPQNISIDIVSPTN